MTWGVLQGKTCEISSEILQTMSQKVLWRMREEMSIGECFREFF